LLCVKAFYTFPLSGLDLYGTAVLWSTSPIKLVLNVTEVGKSFSIIADKILYQRTRADVFERAEFALTTLRGADGAAMIYGYVGEFEPIFLEFTKTYPLFALSVAINGIARSIPTCIYG